MPSDSNFFESLMRTLEEHPEPDAPSQAVSLDFQQIAPGAVFSPRRGAGPNATVRVVRGALVYFTREGDRRADFCGLPHFLAQFSLLQPAVEA